MDYVFYALEPDKLFVGALLFICIFLGWVIIEHETRASATIESLEDEIAGFKIIVFELMHERDAATLVSDKNYSALRYLCDAVPLMTAIDSDILIRDIETFLGDNNEIQS